VSKPTLLPCPFCGSPARFNESATYGRGEGYIYIECSNKACREGDVVEGKFKDAREIVAAHWNRRWVP
jgi:hypothetical protein